MKKNSVKNNRINSEVARALSHIISSEIKDPRIDPMATITRVEVSPDLKYCKVHISVLGSEEAQISTIKGLKNAAPFIRHELAQSVNLRLTPELSFVLDKSIEYGVHMSEVIDKLMASERREEESPASEGDTAAEEEADEEV